MTMNKRLVYIRLDANHQMGLGHLFRMLMLNDCLRSKGGSSLFLIRENPVSERILSEKGIRYSAFPGNAGELEIIDDTLNDSEFYPHYWIFDILNTEIMWIRAVKEKGIKVITFDDEKGGLAEADLVINPIVHLWGNYTPELAKAKLLEGIEYAVMNPRVFKLRKERTISQNTHVSIGITMGGSDTYGITALLVKVLNKLNKGNISITAFAGPHFEHMEELDKEVKNVCCRIEVKRSVQDLHANLDQMDVVICGGGITLFEVMAMGLPSLAFANEPHEELTIRYFQSQGACGSIGSQTDMDEYLFTTRLREYLDNVSILNSFSSSNYKRFRENGTSNSLQAILSL